MAGGFPFGGVCNGQSQGVTLTGNNGTTVTAGAINTKGAWATISSGLPSDCSFIEISAMANPNANDSITIDIGIGPSTPIVLFANLSVAENGNAQGFQVLIPCSLPKGSVISARAQSVLGASVCYVAIRTYDGSFQQSDGYAGCDTLGFNSATTLGTSFTTGSNAKGSWTTISSATPSDYAAIALGLDTLAGAGGQYGSALIDIGIGPSTPKVLIPDVQFLSAPNVQSSVISNIYPVEIPAGSVLSVRGVGVNYSTSNFGARLHGFYK